MTSIIMVRKDLRIFWFEINFSETKRATGITFNITVVKNILSNNMVVDIVLH